jgi:hypothetical protein
MVLLELQAWDEATQDPERRTRLLALVHERQLDDPGPEQLPHVLSHVWHELELESKYSFFEHVGIQRPLLSTGLVGGHVVHWLNEEPEQVLQSGWQERQDEVDGLANVFSGQDEAGTHCPLDAS